MKKTEYLVQIYPHTYEICSTKRKAVRRANELQKEEPSRSFKVIRRDVFEEVIYKTNQPK